MKRIMIIIAATLVGVLAEAAETNAPIVVMPNGVVAATKEQRDFLDKLKTLTSGLAPEVVLKTLGNPATTNTTSWVYHLVENRHEGGYYVHVTLNFGTNGLSGGNVGVGHMARSERKEK